MKILSQRDPKWNRKKLGFGQTTIHSYGCTITSLASLLDLTPDVVNDKLKEVGGYAGTNKNLIIWSKIDEAFDNASFKFRGYEYDNFKVKAAIEAYGGCLVEVDGKPIGAPTHWVLYIGNQKLMDPWVGKIEPTSKYKPTGFAIIAVDKEEEMSDCSEIREARDRHWKRLISILNEAFGPVQANDENIDEYVERVRTRIVELEKSVNDWRVRHDAINDELDKAQASMSGLRGEITKRENKIKELEAKLEAKPSLIGKRKLIAGISAAFIVIIAKIAEKYLGITIAPQELWVAIAGPLAYIGVEGGADFVNRVQDALSQDR